MAKRRRGSKWQQATSDDTDLGHLLGAARRTEVKRGAEFTVQPISAAKALKTYVCPGCQNTIEPGIAHLVTWRNDHLMGEQAGVSERRHWHTHCWRIGSPA